MKPKAVLCTCCAREFTTVYSPRQALGCAAIVHGEGKFITGSYGSTELDLQTWGFNHPFTLDDGAVVCDSCIKVMKENSSIYKLLNSNKKKSWLW